MNTLSHILTHTYTLSHTYSLAHMSSGCTPCYMCFYPLLPSYPCFSAQYPCTRPHILPENLLPSHSGWLWCCRKMIEASYCTSIVGHPQTCQCHSCSTSSQWLVELWGRRVRVRFAMLNWNYLVYKVHGLEGFLVRDLGCRGANSRFFGQQIEIANSHFRY